MPSYYRSKKKNARAMIEKRIALQTVKKGRAERPFLL